MKIHNWMGLMSIATETEQGVPDQQLSPQPPGGSSFRDFRHGVAKSYRAALRERRRTGYPTAAHGRHARKVYWANENSLDSFEPAEILHSPLTTHIRCRRVNGSRSTIDEAGANASAFLLATIPNVADHGTSRHDRTLATITARVA